MIDHRAIVVRETIVSIVINAVISAGFFFAVFGLGAPIALADFGRDFLPQAFMISLMGSLVPGLLMRRHSGAPAGPIVRRALLLAVAGLVLAGGAAFAVCAALGGAIAAVPALAVKVVYGMVLAAVVTPVAVRAALRGGQEARA